MSGLSGWLRQANAKGWVLALDRSRDPSAHLLVHQRSIDHHIVTALTEVSYGYASLGDLENALKWVDLAEQASLLGGTAQSQADVFLCRSSVLLSVAGARPEEASSRLSEALKSADHALRGYREAGLRSSIPGALNQIAAIHDVRGERIPALRNQIQCAISWSQVPQAPGASVPPPGVLANIANRYWALEETELSAGAELLEQNNHALLAAAASRAGEAEMADVLDALGDAFDTAGRAQDALDHWRRAAPIYRLTGRADDEFMVCGRMQAATYVMGRYEEARQNGERCAALRHAITDPADIAPCLHQLAATYYQLKLADMAISTYRDAIGQYRRSEELPEAAGCFLELAVIEIEYGRFSEAKTDLEQMIELPLTQPHAWIARSLLAEVCWHKLSDLGAATRYAEEAVGYSEAGMSPAVRARSLLLAGAAHLVANAADIAFDRLRRACQIVREPAAPDQLADGAFYRHTVTPPALSQAALLACKAARAAGLRTESTKYFLLYAQAVDQDTRQVPENEEPGGVMAAVQRLVTAQNDEEQRQVLENEQALLLTPDADGMFSRLAARARQAEDDRLAGQLETLRALLFEAQVVGVRSAWAKLAASRERAAAAAQASERQRLAAAQSSQGSALEEQVKEMSEEERQALLEKYAAPPLKVVYDTGPDAMGGLSWGVTASSESARFRTTSLESWLMLTSFRDQRRFLEKHPELLGPESTQHLDQLRTVLRRNADTLLSMAGRPPDDIAEAFRDLHAHAELLDDVQARGGNVQAVRDAYVDAHGGFTVDLPQWAEDVLLRLAHPAPAHDGTGLQESRTVLLREAVARAEQDPAVAAETLAEFRNELGRTLARHPAEPRQLSAADSLHWQALQVFEPERYPRQWLRTGLLKAAVEDELISHEPTAARPGHAERIDELMTLGTTHLEAEAWTQAALCFARVTRLVPAHADALLGLARAYQQLKFFTDALAACRAATERAPDRADAWEVMGMLHTRQGELADALSAYQRAVALDPGGANLWFQLAGTLQSLGSREEALDAYERVLSCQPGHLPAWHNKGNLLEQMGRYGEALAAYDHALALAPSMFPTLASKGNALLRLNRPEEAIASFNEALRQAPQFYPSWIGRGAALLLLKRHHEALLALEGAILLNPGEANVFINLAVALEALGRNSEAAGARRHAETLKPPTNLLGPEKVAVWEWASSLGRWVSGGPG